MNHPNVCAVTTSSKTEDLWYSVCYNYFTKGENKSAIEWFQQIDNSTCGENSSNSLTSEQIDFYKQCGIFLITSQEDWYKFDKMKNLARLAAHADMIRTRVALVLRECLVHDDNGVVPAGTGPPRTNASALSGLNHLLSLPGVAAAPMVWTLLDHVCLWIDRWES